MKKKMLNWQLIILKQEQKLNKLEDINKEALIEIIKNYSNNINNIDNEVILELLNNAE